MQFLLISAPLAMVFAMASASALPETQTVASCARDSGVFAAVQLEKDLLSYANTPTPGATANEVSSLVPNCIIDVCKIVGDPHVTRFDKKWVSLLDADADAEANETQPDTGLKYVVKDDKIDIEAFLSGNGPLVTRVDVGGALLENNVISMGPEGKSFTLNDVPIVMEKGDKLEYDYMVAERTQVEEISRNNGSKMVDGYVFYFGLNSGGADWTRLVVNRKAKSLNIAVSRCRDDTQGFAGEVPDHLSVGMCTSTGPVDPVVPIKPQEKPCAKGTCNVYGDPHIIRFDRNWVSLLQGSGSGGQERGEVAQRPGDFWLVNSKILAVQARFGRNGPMMTHVAVGGELMEGNVLIIGGAKEQATWNGDAILSGFPSTFKHRLARLAYTNQTSLVQRKDGQSQSVHGVDVSLPREVKLTINRLPHSINVAITMCESLTGIFSGYCGNMEDESDDTMKLIEGGSPNEVAGGESMFHKLK